MAMRQRKCHFFVSQKNNYLFIESFSVHKRIAMWLICPWEKVERRKDERERLAITFQLCLGKEQGNSPQVQFSWSQWKAELGRTRLNRQIQFLCVLLLYWKWPLRTSVLILYCSIRVFFARPMFLYQFLQVLPCLYDLLRQKMFLRGMTVNCESLG